MTFLAVVGEQHNQLIFEHHSLGSLSCIGSFSWEDFRWHAGKFTITELIVLLGFDSTITMCCPLSIRYWYIVYRETTLLIKEPSNKGHILIWRHLFLSHSYALLHDLTSELRASPCKGHSEILIVFVAERFCCTWHVVFVICTPLCWPHTQEVKCFEKKLKRPECDEICFKLKKDKEEVSSSLHLGCKPVMMLAIVMVY